MTTKKVVADDTLGQIATKQWELYRRAKEGTLDPNLILGALQRIIENEVEQLPIEQLDWAISSRVHEVTVEEGSNFVERVKAVGFFWNYGSRHEYTFSIEGKATSRKRKTRLHLAEFSRRMDKIFPLVVRDYADISGYDLATSWELLAFVKQSPVMRIVKEHSRVIALGDYGRMTYSDDSVRHYFSYVHVAPYTQYNSWSFQGTGMGESLDQLSRKEMVPCYILLRERT